VPDVADGDAAAGEFLVGGFDVGDGQIGGAGRAGRCAGEADADLYRAGRAGRRELHDAEVASRVVVDVKGEAGLLDVERRRLVDVVDGQSDDLEPVIHQAPTMPW
jgi:hypothetical protein